MTAETASDLAEAFREHRDAFGVPVSFMGQEVTGVCNESEFSRDLISGGFAMDAEIKAKVLLSDLPILPSLGKPVTYQGEPFKVSRVAIQPGSLIGEFTLRPGKR